MKIKVIWGILLILTAISLVLYGVGIGPSCFGMPIHKLILAFMFVALIFAKIIHSDTLKEKLKIFTLLSLLFLNSIKPFFAIFAGLVVGILIGNIAEIYTSSDYGQVKEIAKQSQTGHATNIIAGLGSGMQSTALTIIVLVSGIVVAYLCYGN